MSDHRFLRACRRLPVDRTPVWVMRQAGRYLPQYRAVRSRGTFLELLKNPELACEVTLQPIDEFGFDAAILFSDILVPLEAMGMRLEFAEGEGPVLGEPIRNRAMVDALGSPEPNESMPYVMEAIRRIQKGLAGRVPLIGFAGAPFTLASYAVEGGTSKNFVHLKRLLFAAPDAAHALLDKLARVVARFLAAQVAAGVEAVQIFDTWAGILAPGDFDEFAARHAATVVSELRRSLAGASVPIIYYVNGGTPYLERMKAIGADVIGLDWRVELGAARARLPDVAVQGNLDPAALLLPPDRIAARVREIVTAGAAAPGHVFNLGHGIFPEIAVDHVRAMVDAVHQYGRR